MVVVGGWVVFVEYKDRSEPINEVGWESISGIFSSLNNEDSEVWKKSVEFSTVGGSTYSTKFIF